jgi:hypothetical protein
MDISPMQLPGSDYDFHDVTDIFRDAAAGDAPHLKMRALFTSWFT